MPANHSPLAEHQGQAGALEEHQDPSRSAPGDRRLELLGKLFVVERSCQGEKYDYYGQQGL